MNFRQKNSRKGSFYTHQPGFQFSIWLSLYQKITENMITTLNNSTSLANQNVKGKEIFSVVADPVFCFSFSFLRCFSKTGIQQDSLSPLLTYRFDHCRLGFIVPRRPHCPMTVRRKESGNCNDCESSLKKLSPETFFHLGVKEGEKQSVLWPGMWLFFKAKT